MGVAARWMFKAGSVFVIAGGVLLAGCGRYPVATEGASPSAAASKSAACSPTPLITPSEERTPGWWGGEQLPLMRDREAIARYGAEHPDEFAGVTFANKPWVRVVAAFTGNLDAHCEALQELVAHPERLEVIRIHHTVEDLQRIRDEIQSQMTPSGPIEGVGETMGHVEVVLRADGEPLAAELRARYGDAVRLRVGTAPYPPSDSPTAAIACDIGEIDEWPRGVSASVDLEDDVIASGKHGRGTVTIINESDERFRAELGEPEIGWVFEQGGTTPLGAFTGAIGGVGKDVDLAPGEQASLKIVFGTASCDPSRGYALPPGTYDVRVVLPAGAYHETPEGELVPEVTWLSDPARLRIVGSDS
jgi:hypothetical protein